MLFSGLCVLFPSIGRPPLYLFFFSRRSVASRFKASRFGKGRPLVGTTLGNSHFSTFRDKQRRRAGRQPRPSCSGVGFPPPSLREALAARSVSAAFSRRVLKEAIKNPPRGKLSALIAWRLAGGRSHTERRREGLDAAPAALRWQNSRFPGQAPGGAGEQRGPEPAWPRGRGRPGSFHAAGSAGPNLGVSAGMGVMNVKFTSRARRAKSCLAKVNRCSR